MDRKPNLQHAASLNNLAAAVQNAHTCAADGFKKTPAQQDHFRARTAAPNQLRLKYEAWMSKHGRGNEAATAATLFVSPAHALSHTVFVPVHALKQDAVALVKKQADSHVALCRKFVLTFGFFLAGLQVCVGEESLSQQTS